jgi:amidophosphoribosyltransferase
MSDFLSHECGLAFVRLKHPLSYYQEKYGTPLWGFYKLFLLMEKQHNRGQDGAGIGACKLGVKPGYPFMFRERSVEPNPLDRIFRRLLAVWDKRVQTGDIHPEFAATAKTSFDFAAEVYLGHLRYGTSGGYNESCCHPYFRKNNWAARNLLLAGNFNMTNTPELNHELIDLGQHPVFDTDTQTLLEELGHWLDEEHRALREQVIRENPGISGEPLARQVEAEMNPGRILAKASKKWDGGYSLVGVFGGGDAFLTRDPCGIRPLHYFEDDEVLAAASERVPLMTIFSKPAEAIEEVLPGQAIIIKANGTITKEQVRQPLERRSCSFERIYFSRGNDPEIYQERKKLGAALVPSVLKAIGDDFDRTVFSFIPNTAEVAYQGFIQGLEEHLRRQRVESLLSLQESRGGQLTRADIESAILGGWPRTEKVAHKDIKLRTFITQEKARRDLVSHVYDISYGSVLRDDTLVVLDDSIVRGTTLRESIIAMLARLNPRRIIIVSTAPQIRYPDVYGIDMSEIEKFVAFKAVVCLLKETGRDGIISEVYRECHRLLEKPEAVTVNPVAKLYEPFTPEAISAKIAQLIRPEIAGWTGSIEVIFQSIEALHQALPGNSGDWYFTGNYPTTGGYRCLLRAFVNYYERRSERSY